VHRARLAALSSSSRGCRTRPMGEGPAIPSGGGTTGDGTVFAVRTVRVGEFEWDDAKARANGRKHGVTFEEAMTVFLDELAVPLERASIGIG
jgi:hypothetical protein